MSEKETKPKVLVVDDSTSVRRYAMDTLCRAGFTVMGAPNGRSGLDMIDKFRPDVMLLDIMMPEMNGIEVLASLRRKNKSLSVLLFTSRSADRDIVSGLEAGADDYIVKPFQDRELIARVNAAARRAVLERELIGARNAAVRNSRSIQRLLGVIRRVNQLIIQGKEREKLLQGVCEILYQSHKYYAVWMSLTDDCGNFTHAFGNGLKKGISLFVEQIKYGIFPQCCKRALYQTHMEVVQDQSSECPDCLLRENCADGGVFAIRLAHEGVLFGVLAVSVYLDLVDIREEEILLEEIAGDVSFALHSLEDSKRRRQVEAEKKRLRTVVQQSIDGIAITDMNLILTYVNDSFARMHAYCPQEMIGMGMSRLVSDDQMEKLQKITRPVRDNGSWLGEAEHIRKDKTTFPTYISATLVKDEVGIPVAIGFVTRDNSLRKKLESQVLQFQRRESLGTLAGGIAHDFNNILSPIIGFSELCMDSLLADGPMRRNIQEILTAANRAKELVWQILAFSRQSDEARTAVLVQSVLKEALKLLRASIPSTISIRQDINVNCGPVFANQTQVHQVVMNLCTNAYHAMQEKGGIMDIILDDWKMGVDGRKANSELLPGEYVRLTIIDTGHGIDPAIRASVFDPYFTTKSPGQGTGMGLAIVHGIIKSYGGDITVDSEPGKGATFRVYFPRMAETASGEKLVPDGHVPGGNETVLFVDDEEMTVRALKQILDSLGYQTTVRTSSVEALETFKAKPDRFDLVITDMTMPNMTGIELSTSLLKIRPDIPIIICTGFSESLTSEKANALGIRGYLLKPLVKSEIARSIRKVLDRKEKES